MPVARCLFLASLLIAALTLLAGCGDGYADRIQATRDPCEFVLDFGMTCTPAGRASICTRPRTIIARSTAPECAR